MYSFHSGASMALCMLSESSELTPRVFSCYKQLYICLRNQVGQLSTQLLMEPSLGEDSFILIISDPFSKALQLEVNDELANDVRGARQVQFIASDIWWRAFCDSLLLYESTIGRRQMLRCSRILGDQRYASYPVHQSCSRNHIVLS